MKTDYDTGKAFESYLEQLKKAIPNPQFTDYAEELLKCAFTAGVKEGVEVAKKIIRALSVRKINKRER